jgi:hypothetical protein
MVKRRWFPNDKAGGIKKSPRRFIQAALLGEDKVTRFDPWFEENKSLCERWSSNSIRHYGW